MYLKIKVLKYVKVLTYGTLVISTSTPAGINKCLSKVQVLSNVYLKCLSTSTHVLSPMPAMCYPFMLSVTRSFLTSKANQSEPLWPNYLSIVLNSPHIVTNFFYLQEQLILGSCILISKELWIDHGSSRTILQVQTTMNTLKYIGYPNSPFLSPYQV